MFASFLWQEKVVHFFHHFPWVHLWPDLLGMLGENLDSLLYSLFPSIEQSNMQWLERENNGRARCSIKVMHMLPRRRKPTYSLFRCLQHVDVTQEILQMLAPLLCELWREKVVHFFHHFPWTLRVGGVCKLTLQNANAKAKECWCSQKLLEQQTWVRILSIPHSRKVGLPDKEWGSAKCIIHARSPPRAPRRRRNESLVFLAAYLTLTWRLQGFSLVMIRVPQTILFLVVVGILFILFSNIPMVRKLQHGYLPINGLSTKLSRFPPLPEIRLFEEP